MDVPGGKLWRCGAGLQQNLGGPSETWLAAGVQLPRTSDEVRKSKCTIDIWVGAGCGGVLLATNLGRQTERADFAPCGSCTFLKGTESMVA